MKWDAPVIRYLPWFQMWDPYVTRELTIRDLLVHRSGLGLGAGDLLWWPASTYDRPEIARRLRFIRPATSFRSAYAYDNVLYLVAGEVIEAVSGQRWEDFVTARILEPVGMTTSNVRHSDARRGGNVATPHAPLDGKVRPIAPFESDNTNPAGGINSNAQDMAKWLTVFLARGRLPDGSRLFSEGTWRQLTTIVTPLSTPEPPPELAPLRANFRGYALGLNAVDYRGQKMLMHTGGLPGYVSRVMMVPDLQLGIAVLTNQESGEAFDSIAYRIADHFLSPSTSSGPRPSTSSGQGAGSVPDDRELRADAYRDVCAESGRHDRPGQDARRVARDGLQLRLSRLVAEAKEEREVLNCELGISALIAGASGRTTSATNLSIHNPQFTIGTPGYCRTNCPRTAPPGFSGVCTLK